MLKEGHRYDVIAHTLKVGNSRISRIARENNLHRKNRKTTTTATTTPKLKPTFTIEEKEILLIINKAGKGKISTEDQLKLMKALKF